MNGLLKIGSPFLFVIALSGVALAQSAQQFADAEAGVDVGFDPTPVEIPSVPKTAPRPVTSMDLLMLRDIHGMQISPDGKYVAFVVGQAVYETNSYRSGLFVIGTEKGSRPVSLGSAGPPRWDAINQWTSEDPQWSANSRYIYRTMKTSGSWQVWRWDRKGSAPAQITQTKRDVQSFFLSPDGTKLVAMLETPSTINKKKLVEGGILYDGSFEATAQSILDRIAARPGGESEAWTQVLRNGSAHKASEAEIAGLNLYSDTGHDPIGTMFRRMFTQKEIDELRILNFAMSPDRKRIAYSRMATDSSDPEWDNFLILVKPLGSDAPVTVATWPNYPCQYWWSSDSKEIYYAAHDDTKPNDMDRTKIMAVPTTGGAPRQVLESDGFLEQYSVDKSTRLLTCVRENNATPSEVVLADLSTGEIRTLLDVNPELQNLQINSAKRIDLVDKRGEPFWGHLVLPLGYEPGKRYPLVITTYADYGFLRGGVGDEYPIHVFVANGFAVLNFNALGRFPSSKAGDFEKTVRLWQGPTEAIEAAVTKLTDIGIVDSSRVAITGLSYGASLVDYGISHSSLFHAAAASGASWDPIIFYLASDQGRAGLRELNLGAPTGASGPMWQRASAALNASRVHTPLLINSADAEYIYAMQLVNTLRDLKKPVEMWIYLDERHEKNQPKHRYSIYQRNLDWLNFWLRDKEDPDPAKAEQYKRWHELRTLQEKDQEQALAQKQGLAQKR
jgi:dipeptidyl aminopeptidase/acylaminoacyl peptidase